MAERDLIWRGDVNAVLAMGVGMTATQLQRQIDGIEAVIADERPIWCVVLYYGGRANVQVSITKARNADEALGRVIGEHGAGLTDYTVTQITPEELT